MESSNSGLNPRQGTYLVGAVAFVASLLATKTADYFKRLTLLYWGHFLMAIIHCCIALFCMNHMDTGVITMVLLFFFIYQNTSSSVAWLYAAETTIDAGMGIVLLTLWATVFVLSIVCPIIMDPGSIGPNITFFIFSGLSVLGGLYSFFFIKETYGKSDREKKLMFTPIKYIH